MPKIVFVDPTGAPKEHETSDATDLLDVCDEVLAPIPFSCRSATCGTCQVEVEEGMELLEPPSDEEVELLEMLAPPENVRLACQARVKAGPGLIRLKPVGV